MDQDRELEELIRKAQSQPGVFEMMDIYNKYAKLLQQSGIKLEESANDVISSYSYNSS